MKKSLMKLTEVQLIQRMQSKESIVDGMGINSFRGKGWTES